jgi:hypothetical protein
MSTHHPERAQDPTSPRQDLTPPHLKRFAY